MKFPIEILSTETIKPSSETPLHLRKLKLSYLDQIRNPIYTPIIFFYEADESKGLTGSYAWKISHQLKQSLSKALTSFYPLAGRIESTTIIDCNDYGVEFIEARAHATLKEVMNSPDVQEFKKFLPRDPADFNGTLLLVKVTFFQCGGLTIGLCFSHKVADFVSMMAFINAWASISRGSPDFARFSFDLASHFPARDLPEPEPWAFADQNDLAKVFVLDKEILARLKSAATSSYVENPTKVEAVLAFVWKSFINANLYKNPNSKGIFVGWVAMNLRTRAVPPPDLGNVFGNCYMTTNAYYDPHCPSEGDQYKELVRSFRSAIQLVDGDFVRQAQVGDSYFKECYKYYNLYLKGEVRGACPFTSWCRFPLYEVDFGWGNPSWVGSAMPTKNSVVMVDTRCGKGVEVWVNMERHVVEMLEEQIRSITSS